ncbi:2-oxoacid:acceptor oxidoreductase family protein [Desulfonatronovibrio hydrogenovorans]|uniref:2-oxoacid:acceptor oxidoreductase family protein n=1 Tax=Desulfonatronovibrio hydrogenovorans TaxID=53245 RepID=UPI00048E8043|nr:2-oxoacid:acceptor oxidoreductase family protein [Desulfonatronovibrio hydrogenovorans]
MNKDTKLDRFEIRLSGLGGQGILTLGKIMGQALALDHGYFVTQTQSYGPEARGGASRSDLVISSKPISYPKTISLDLLVALSQEACNKFFSNLKPGGVLVVDTSLVPQTPTNIFWGLPFTDMARKVGLVQTTNIVTLGALTHFLPFMRATAVRKSLKSVLPSKIIDINIKAFNAGFNRAKKDYPTAPEKWKSS